MRNITTAAVQLSLCPGPSAGMCRMKDVGKSKAEIAAERIMARIEGVTVTPHFCRIEEKPLDFFQEFQIWVLGLDSLDARRYMNQIACSFLREQRPPPACMTNRPDPSAEALGAAGQQVYRAFLLSLLYI